MKPDFSIRLGINPISWSNDDLPSLGAETPLTTALQEGRTIGYEGFEMNGKFPRTGEAVRCLLQKHDLKLISGWYSGYLAHRTTDEEIPAAAPHLNLLAQNNVKILVYGEVAGSIQGLPVPLYKRPRFCTDNEWLVYANRLTAFAKHTLQQYGIRLAYHHHMGAYIQSLTDVDRLMELTGEEVGLLFDSGHITFAGGQAEEFLKKHLERICHVHFKDVRLEVVQLARNRSWSFLESVLNGAFTVPGDGAINFAPLLKCLQLNGYQGWIVVEAEQDPTVAPSFAYAQKGYQTLHSLLYS
jgi:inosose dehydratase